MAGHIYNGREIELLIPASSLEVLKTAVIFGADAVYMGTSSLSLRSRVSVDDNELEKTIKYAHSLGKKVYAAVNIFAFDEKYDEVIAIGPVVMMKAVVGVTKPRDIKTMVSLNPIMIDGTGMCGCCRVTVDGKIKFACVDGPDFDGLNVDFDELMARQRMFKEEEHLVDSNADRMCNLMKGVK